MHFWIDKTQYSYGVGRNKFIHKPLHHQRRQILNTTLSRQWLKIYVTSAVCITIILVLLVAKLYYDVLLSKFQLICFYIISLIFLICTVMASIVHCPKSIQENQIEKRNSNTIVIDELPPPEYCDSFKLSRNDRPPSYDKLFEV